MERRNAIVERTAMTGRAEMGELTLLAKDDDEVQIRGRFQAIQLHGERYVLLTVHEVLRRGRRSVAA
jgi:hypothetical protein